ncbi:MAG TPA: efflux RND transporter periplasmic adaptor subunit [Thermoguttaceae bacterium]
MIVFRWLFAGILAVVFLAAIGCESKPPALAELPPPEVTVSKPIAQEVTDFFPIFTGRTEAVDQVEVRARVSGYIVKIYFQDGQEVKQGDLLVQIDPRPYQAALDLALAEVARSQALLAKAKADLARADKLLPTRTITQEEYDQYAAAKGVAEAQLQASQASVRDAQLNLDFTKVTSPIQGRTSRARITVGNLVQASPTGSAELTTIVSTDPMYVYFDIDESTLFLAQQIARDKGENARPDHIKDLKYPLEISLANEEGFPHRGILDFADNKVDPSTGTISIRGVFDNSARYLTPGMFTRVRLPASDPHKALLVSESALGTDRDKKFLMVVDKDKVAQYHQVRLGSVQGDLRVIESGIQPDDEIIVNGIQRVRPGMKVTPHPGPMPGVLEEDKSDKSTTVSEKPKT